MYYKNAGIERPVNDEKPGYKRGQNISFLRWFPKICYAASIVSQFKASGLLAITHLDYYIGKK